MNACYQSAAFCNECNLILPVRVHLMNLEQHPRVWGWVSQVLLMGQGMYMGCRAGRQM